MAPEINSLTSQIGALNLQIENVQGGNTSGSDAVGLEDQRLQALQSLSQLVGIQTVQQTNGSVSVYVGGEYLVSDGIVRSVVASERSDGGQTVTDLRIAGTNTPLASILGPTGRIAASPRHRAPRLPRQSRTISPARWFPNSTRSIPAGRGSTAITTVDQRVRRQRSERGAERDRPELRARQRLLPGAGLRQDHRTDRDEQHQRRSQRHGKRHDVDDAGGRAEPGQRHLGEHRQRQPPDDQEHFAEPGVFLRQRYAAAC